MSYAAWSVVFGEQPSAAKWNILGSNDSSFNDGTGIGTNAIAAASLATTAIKLGKLLYTTSQTSMNATSVTQVTGMTLTVTIPAGGRDVKISCLIPNAITVTSAVLAYFSIWDGTVGSGTQLQEVALAHTQAGYVMHAYAMAIVTPAAGSKTYNIGYRVNSNSISTQLSSTVPAIILAEAI